MTLTVPESSRTIYASLVQAMDLQGHYTENESSAKPVCCLKSGVTMEHINEKDSSS